MGATGGLTEDRDEEDSLLARARSGDGSAFEQLVELHAPAVYRIVAGHLGETDAEDAAQEVFTRIFLGLKGFKGDARFATWVYRIATNVALTRGKKKRRRLGFENSASPAPEPEAGEPGPHESLARGEQRDAVRSAIEQLPEEFRAVVVLRGIEGLPFEEVARVLGILRPTAESRMARAKERLRTLLGRIMGD